MTKRDLNKVPRPPAQAPVKSKGQKWGGYLVGVFALAYALLTVSLALLLPKAFAADNQTTRLSDHEQQALIYMLKQDCGSCHGLTLQGGLGPAILQKNLQGKPQAYLEVVIANGRPGTAMPAWKNLLSAEQITFLAEYLLSAQNVLQVPVGQVDANLMQSQTEQARLTIAK